MYPDTIDALSALFTITYRDGLDYLVVVRVNRRVLPRNSRRRNFLGNGGHVEERALDI